MEIQRRKFIKSAAITSLVGVSYGAPALSAGNGNSPYSFEIQRTDAQWKAMFDADTYRILRQGGTEKPKSSLLWNDYRDGTFNCKGCGLHNYDSIWRVELDKGWVFFRQSRPDALLMGIDGEPPQGMGDEANNASIEVHCRRCGSHMGHVLLVAGCVLHCINGKALEFTQA